MERRKFLSLSGMAAFAAMAPAALNAEDFRASKPDVWTSHTVDDSIKKMYGDITLVEEGVSLKAPDVAANGGAIPVKFGTKIDAKTIAMFQDANPESAVMVCTVHPNSVVDYEIKIKMKASGTITIVVEGKDGKFYAAKKTLEVALGGCEG